MVKIVFFYDKKEVQHGKPSTFYMRIRENCENCDSFMWDIPADTEVDEKHGTKKDSMYFINVSLDSEMS